MGIDRKNYVMSVELAMQREMAYSEKLEKGNAGPCSSSAVIILQTLYLSRVPSSTLTRPPITTPTPGPNPYRYRATQVISLNPSPIPYIVPIHAQSPPPKPNLYHLGIPRQTPNPIPLMRPYLTRISRPTYPAHEKRKTSNHHQPKCLELLAPEDFHCNLCQVDCTSEINLRMHFRGHKHKAVLRNLLQELLQK